PTDTSTLSLHDALPISELRLPLNGDDAGDFQVGLGDERVLRVIFDEEFKFRARLILLGKARCRVGLAGGKLESRLGQLQGQNARDRKSTRLNSSHVKIS